MMNPQQTYVAMQTIVEKEIRRFMRIWVQTLIPPAITIGLYFLIFGRLIGSRIGDMNGFSYMQFIVPGLIMMSVITNSYANVVSSFFSTKFQKSIEELLVSPTPNYVVIWGYVIGGMARGLAVGLIVSVLAMSLAKLSVQHLMITLSMAVLTSTLFALGGFINAVYAKKFDDITIVPTFVLTPLTYLGGVFYSIELLPDFWHGLSLINPIVYMVNGFRYGLLGISDVGLMQSYFVILVAIIGLYTWAHWLLVKGVGIRN